MNLPLNEVFLKNSREYGMNQLIAAKYQPGMETGFLVCYCYQSQEGYRFFDNRQQAEEFVKLKPLQDLLVDGRWEKVSCVYHAPDPVLHVKLSPIEKKINEAYNLNLKGNFREDEADEYQFVILEPGVWVSSGILMAMCGCGRLYRKICLWAGITSALKIMYRSLRRLRGNAWLSFFIF